MVFALLLAPASLASEQFRADCDALTKASHRLSGTPEYRAAADYVEKRLREIGPDELLVQEFPSVQTRTKRCEIEIRDAVPPPSWRPGPGSKSQQDAGGTAAKRPVRRKLLPMRPNGIIPPVTPPEGITGPILHAGAGETGDLGNRSPRGAIVVLDYNAGRAWLRAFRLGAKAVVFVANGEPQAWQPHFVDANANLPRFFYPGTREELPDGASATLHSEVAWEGATGRNILAFFRGTEPEFFQEKDELVLVGANLDTFGEVPELSPGARGAANCAALLKLAEHIKANRPRRHVLFAFFDAQARCHAGSSAFYRALEKDDRAVRLSVREESLESERVFLDRMTELLKHQDPLRGRSSVRRELVNRLKRSAAAHAYEIGSVLYNLRKAGAAGQPAIENQRQAEKDRWNDLRRALARDRFTSETQAELAVALADVRRDVEVRVHELDIEGRALKCDQALSRLIGGQWLSLHVSLLLGDATPRWGLIVGGDSSIHSRSDDPGVYGRIQATFLKAHESLKATGTAPEHFETASADGTLDPPRLLWGAPFVIHCGEPAGRLGIYSIAIGTCQERLSREGTPADTLAALDLARVEAQVAEIAPLLTAAASQDGLSLRRSIMPDKLYLFPEFLSDNRAHGPTVMGRLPGSSMPDQPRANAIVQITLKPRGAAPYADLLYQPKKPYAFDDFLVLRTDQNGSYGYGPVPTHWQTTGFAAGFDERGAVTAASDLASATNVRWRLNTVECRGGVAVLPPQLDAQPTQVLRAWGNSPLDDSRSYSKTLDGVAYWYCEDKVEGIKLFGLQSIVGLVTGEERLQETEKSTTADGVGYPMGAAWEIPASTRRSAVDLWRLDESRLGALRSRGILNSSIEELHGRAEDLLREGDEAANDELRMTNDESKPEPTAQSPPLIRHLPTLRHETLAAAAFLAERPVYETTRSMLNDLVHAVLVLLALSVPFAFALERLLIGATSIYRQIAWFAGFFSLTFLVLFLTHPAFAISKTPIIIFLGFAVVVLSALVIVILMRKFEVELKVLQGLATTVHAADVSRFSTVLAAMSMGISTMRRRPLRTALTATTIIMLTFTILCFASFGTQTGIVKIFSGPSAGYTGAFLHRVSWGELNRDILDLITERWGAASVPSGSTAAILAASKSQQDAGGTVERRSPVTVCARYWLSGRTAQAKGPLVTREDGSRPVALRGVLGLEARELARRPGLMAQFGDGRDDWANSVFMTQAVADRLSVRAGDWVIVGGVRLRVRGVLDASAVSAVKDMDGNSILPVDFVAMQSAQTDTTQAEDASSALREQNWAYLPTDTVVIVSAESALLMGASLHAVSLYTDDSRSATQLTEDLARMLPLAVSGTRADGVYRHVLGTLVEASGAGDLLFPILLGGLVIFGTMLGSVADRQKEIYTFSSLGLAPPHVASLFFAEAMVYSVLGGLAGYLLAEASLKGLSVLADYGLLRVPEMNYSSANAIVTILIVMATVLASAIYPAIKASRSANPGILRTWRLPPAKGDVLDIVFPFTVSEYDITGVVSFLKEHFDNFGDTGLGRFMAKGARRVRGVAATSGSPAAATALGLDAHISLAPFDLGVTQSFELRSAPSEIPGIDVVTIRLTRLSGQPKDWWRLNKVLLDDLRRQFLIWRALSPETMELYRQRTVIEMGASEEKPD